VISLISVTGIEWANLSSLSPAKPYTCGYCAREVASQQVFGGTFNDMMGTTEIAQIAICPRCTHPTFFFFGAQRPGPRFGASVDFLPEEVSKLYDEARDAMAVEAFTASVLTGRKLLMNIAVTHDANPGEPFAYYVDYFVENGIVTAGMKPWVDEIRELGNDATHEIPEMDRAPAESLLSFLELLLKVVYEYPERGRRSVVAREGGGTT
jgi:hypothetical protein